LYSLWYVTDAKYTIFKHKYSRQNDGDPHEQIKGVNPSYMQPCRYVHLNKVK